MYKGYDFKFTKSLGQNFLKSDQIVNEILKGAKIGPRDLVIEIGPGMGALTKPAAAMARRVIAIEIDKHLMPILSKELCGCDNVAIINDDILNTDIAKLIKEAREEDPGLKDARIIGNLPYYITTPIIMKILGDGADACSITVMMQKEVADRINASPGGKDYGALTVAVRYHCNVEEICDVPRSVFVPSPKVDSKVLRLDIRKEKAVHPRDEKLFMDCVRAAFSQRRKTIANCLSGFGDLEKNRITDMLERAGIPKNARAEILSIEDFAQLADMIQEEIQ